MASPIVTVLMPAMNAARYLPEAIESIQQQTFKDLELIILDGGSTDPTPEIVRAYAARDKRVRLESFPGAHPCKRIDDIVPTLSSRYVAIQHSDDISYADRIETQMQAFTADPALGVCSGLCRSFWHDRMQQARAEGGAIHTRPEHHPAIKAQLLFWWVMHCPTMMYERAKMLAANLKFVNEFAFSNDYWQTVAHIDKLKYHNIQRELSAYRLHHEGDGARNRDALRQEELKLKQKILNHFGFVATPREMEIHVHLRIIPDGMIGAKTPKEYTETAAWLDNLQKQNDAKGTFDRAYFAALITALKSSVQAIQARQAATA